MILGLALCVVSCACAWLMWQFFGLSVSEAIVFAFMLCSTVGILLALSNG